jgi:CMP-N,N'-diacetyllegionaminic acid synthase
MKSGGDRILAIIPARGGSKGVPRKNVKILNGKPLIEYIIQTALGCQSISKVMVSTDDIEIAEISEKAGALVPELRPRHLADDKSPTIDTISYIIDFFKKRGEQYDSIILLQPTSPFTSKEDIEISIEKYRKNDCDSLVSVYEVPTHFNPYWVFKESKEDILDLIIPQEIIISRRQDLPKTFIRSGNIYIAKTKLIAKYNTFYGKKLGFYQIDESKNVNIDTLDDWQEAERLLKKESND